MNIQIDVGIENPKSPLREIEGIPVYPMGQEIFLTVNFSNNGSGELTLEDPGTSQFTLIYIQSEDSAEETVVFLNPSLMDATGEITAPVSKTIKLLPQDTIAVPIELHKNCIDYIFRHGKYEMYIEYQDTKSEKLNFAVEFCPESVPRLIDITIDESIELWMREESLEWLEKMPVHPELILPPAEESEEAKTKREKTNQENANTFLQKWPDEMNSEATKEFFDSAKLE